MTVTINLPPEKESALKAQARAKGLSVEEWLLQLAIEAAGVPPKANTNLADVCSMVKGLADDLNLKRNLTQGRAVDL